MEITNDKITEFFCIADDFCKEFDKEIEKMAIKADDGRKHRKRKTTMSRSEIMAILIFFHFNTFRNFKHYYLFYVQVHLKDLFPNQLSYNRFVELESRVSLQMMMFLQLCCFGTCTGISFIGSTCIPVCHNKRILPFLPLGRFAFTWYLIPLKIKSVPLLTEVLSCIYSEYSLSVMPISVAASYSETALVIAGATPYAACHCNAILAGSSLNIVFFNFYCN